MNLRVLHRSTNFCFIFLNVFRGLEFSPVRNSSSSSSPPKRRRVVMDTDEDDEVDVETVDITDTYQPTVLLRGVTNETRSVCVRTVTV